MPKSRRNRNSQYSVDHDNQNTTEVRVIMFEWFAALAVVVVYSRVMTVHAARLCEPAPTRSLGDGEEQRPEEADHDAVVRKLDDHVLGG